MTDFEDSASGDLEDSASGELGLTRARLIRSAAVAAAGIVAADPLGKAAFAAPDLFAQKPKRGGRLRVGMIGGGAKETLNPNQLFNEIDIARVHQLYERLVRYDNRGGPENQLAADFSSNRSATVWKIKTRREVEWHDGSPFTSDDVVYSFRYMATKKNNSGGYSDISFLKPSQVRRLDRSTVEIRLDQPNALLPVAVAARTLWIFKDGTRSFRNPIGTGQFKAQTFKPGERSVFVRNPDYRMHDGPYVDALEIISFTNDTARTNAIRGGVIDAMPGLSLNLAKTFSGGNIRLLRVPRAATTELTMAVDMPPFNDNRVRRAFRLMVDRRQMVDNALAGFGVVGNDLFWPADPDYASGIPQRRYDPEEARSLLRAAGREDLTVSLYTSDVETALLESSTLFVEQAKKAGVTVVLDQVPGDQYYTNKYLKAPFAGSAWTARPLITQISQTLLSSAPYNETHWKNATFDRLVSTARRTLDPARRKELFVEAQRLLWSQGGYIIWGFRDYVDAYASKVNGLQKSVARPLGAYNFIHVHIT